MIPVNARKLRMASHAEVKGGPVSRATRQVGASAMRRRAWRQCRRHLAGFGNTYTRPGASWRLADGIAESSGSAAFRGQRAGSQIRAT